MFLAMFMVPLIERDGEVTKKHEPIWPTGRNDQNKLSGVKNHPELLLRS